MKVLYFSLVRLPVSFLVYFLQLELEKIINDLQGVLFVLKFVNVLNANQKNVVLKIEDSYFELEDFLSQFCSQTRGLFGPLWKRVVV